MASPHSNHHPQHIPLDKGPYSVLYRVASFLPPASNYRLKQVSRNFTDAVQRLTENWVIPFIYCNQFQQTTHAGLFYFADLEVKLSTKPLQTPKVEIRTGKSYYKEVNHAQVADVVEAMIDFGKDEMELASKSCPFAQPVMVLVDSIPLARSVESYLIEKVRFNAPVAFSTRVSSSETKKDDDDESSQNKVFPSVFVKLLHTNQEHSETLEIAEKNKSTSQKLTPDLIRKSILSSVFAVIPEKLPSFRPEGDDDENNTMRKTTTSTIQAQNGTDAARHCGRPPFSVLFSHLPGAVKVHDTNSNQATKVYMDKLKDETGRILKDSLGPLLRRKFGIRTSPSLMKILSDVNNFFDKDTQVFILLKSDLPRYIGPDMVIDGDISESIIESEEQQSPDCWKSYWSKRIFILGPPKKADEHPKFITDCYGPDTPFTSNVVQPLKQKIFRNLNDRLLVGENEDGVPVEITINSLCEYFRIEAQNHETSGLASATYYDGMVPFRVSTATEKDIVHVLSTFLVHHQDLSGNTRRLFIADDVSLGTIMSEDLYFPNPLIRKTNPHCPWKDVVINNDDNNNNNNNDNNDTDNSSSKKKKPSSRLLTPWILVGEVGTFSDEHIEPEGLHVWVHLFIGTKLWFVERKTENNNNNNNKRPDDKDNQEEKDCEWDMFFQRENQTIVVPPNWRHFVLNITPTFAVAQNFVG